MANHNYAPAVLEAFRNNLVSWCVAPPETISNEWLQGYQYAIALMEDMNYHTGATALETWLEDGTGITNDN